MTSVTSEAPDGIYIYVYGKSVHSFSFPKQEEYASVISVQHKHAMVFIIVVLFYLYGTLAVYQ